MEKGPIFIGGLAHSGKTPLRLMLSAHPDLALTRQTYMWTHFYERYGDLAQAANLDRCLGDMLRHKGIKALSPEPKRIRSEFSGGALTYARLFEIFHRQHAEQIGKTRWGDQLGFVERFADVIFAAFPNAKMIHMIRDPRERHNVATSVSRSRKGKVGWNVARWLHSADLTCKNQKLYPDNYKVVRYETLMAEPEKTIREICDFLDEEFLPAMVQREDLNVASNEKNTHRVTNGSKSLANDGSVSGLDIKFTQTYAREHMLAFDYPLQSIHFSLRERLLWYLVDWPTNRAGMFAWQIAGAKSLKEV
jgi:hypothetical protein